ncbi:hypothetical protein [Psychrobacillus soli]|uniref:Uncharacterized protein n=1 Tax=Psychrobacillus soli TaxID=1543965 RepID=A0A544TDN0_9BACI|nr:hypothetical protein [Psychrobacillus soli]TQR15541.1 hypothetical protein FG383_08010 [Psychrobacillus soli]
MGRLKDKGKIITDVTNGQGTAKPRLFTNEGTNLVVTDIQEELLAKKTEVIDKMHTFLLCLTVR